VTLEQCWHRVPGGVATSALQVAAALARRPEVDPIGLAARHRRPPPSAFRAPIPVTHLGLPRALLYPSWHHLRRPAVERATGPVDAIYVTGMAMPPRTAPMVVTVHDLAWRDFDHHTARGRRFFEAAFTLARQEADRVLCPSRATMTACREAGIDEGRLRLVPWGVDPTRASDDDVAGVRAAHGLRRPYLLWTGTVEPRKNLPGLLAAFARLGRSDVDLVLVGPHGWNEDLVALLEGGPPGVHPLGFVSPHDLRALYAGAEVFCYPSLSEGFGLPVLEALAQGTPVVTSAGTATEEILGAGGRAVDPGDPSAIADAVATLLDDPVERAAAQAGASRQVDRYTWSATADAVVAAVREVIG